MMQDAVNIAQVMLSTVRRGVSDFMYDWKPFKAEFNICYNISGSGDYTWRAVIIDCNLYWDACLQQAIWYEGRDIRRGTLDIQTEVVQRVVIGSAGLINPESDPTAFFLVIGEEQKEYPNAVYTEVRMLRGGNECTNDLFMGRVTDVSDDE